MIYWFTGQPSSGKTTLAKLLVKQLEKQGQCVKHIDGDGLRELTQNFDYTESGRRSNIKKAQEIAKAYKTDGCVVVVSVVAPYRDLRESFKAKENVQEFYIHTSQKRAKDHFHAADYQAPMSNYIDINTDFPVDTSFREIMNNLKNKQPFAMFVGRYQPLHDGHKWLFQQQLDNGKKILICVRDMVTNDQNPFTAHQVKENILAHYKSEILDGLVQVIIIPDIESINYGRGVGYDIIEHKPPKQIKEISATKIRNSKVHKTY